MIFVKACVTLFSPPNGACPILEQTPSTCSYSECHLKLVLLFSKFSAIILRLRACTQVLNNPFLRQTSTWHETDPTEGIAFCPKCCHDAWMRLIRIYISFSFLCVLGKILKRPEVSICLSAMHRIPQSNHYYLPHTSFQGFLKKKKKLLFIFFMTRNVINLSKSDVSQRGFIQQSSPER